MALTSDAVVQRPAADGFRRQRGSISKTRQRHRKAAMRIADNAVLVTGANRGLGHSLVEEALRRGAFSVTQSLRALLVGQGVKVHAVMAGPIDTDMVRDLPIPKAPSDSVARGIFDGIQNDEEEILPDRVSEMMAESWRTGAAKALERQNATLIAAEPLTSDAA
jgi:NAD(P)-dependent dehydrogenase (short-subunit alcohol dehydrogenase family)